MDVINHNRSLTSQPREFSVQLVMVEFPLSVFIDWH